MSVGPISSTPLLASPSDLLPKQKVSKIHDAAQQFEALMIGEMLKSVREASSDGWLGSGDSDASDSALGMAEGQLSTAIASGGGIGLANMIERSVTKQVSQKVNASSDAAGVVSK